MTSSAYAIGLNQLLEKLLDRLLLLRQKRGSQTASVQQIEGFGVTESWAFPLREIFTLYFRNHLMEISRVTVKRVFLIII